MECVNEERSSELLEAQAHIWNHVFKYINSMSLKCATELGIPDVIHKHGGSMTLLELVDALPSVDKSKADCVYRLMRILVHSGFFVLEKLNSSNEEGYSLTPASCLLVGDHPWSMKPLVLSQLDPILTDHWQHCSLWFQTTEDRTAYDTANRMSFWKKKENNPRFSRWFDQGLESDTPLVTGAIISNCREVFEGLDSLVDVGGGTGTLAKAIADAFPAIHCTVLDLAPVIVGLEETRKLKYIEGDMFEYIPSSDAVLLKWILHDWSDKECVHILKKCKEAITRNDNRGKVIIIEMVVDDQKGDPESVENQLFLDIQMMTLVGGRERKEEEWANLFCEAGFSNYTISPFLGLRSIIQVYP